MAGVPPSIGRKILAQGERWLTSLNGVGWLDELAMVQRWRPAPPTGTPAGCHVPKGGRISA